jgi:hypothetical protein
MLVPTGKLASTIAVAMIVSKLYETKIAVYA